MKLPKPLEKLYDKAIKEAEKVIGNDTGLSKLIDAAFDKLGDGSQIFYEIQDKVLALFRLVKTWAKREYTDVSPKTIVIAVAALLYLVNPMDFIPDIIPLTGLLDDFTIVTYVLALISEEIDKFSEWERKRKEQQPVEDLS